MEISTNLKLQLMVEENYPLRASNLIITDSPTYLRHLQICDQLRVVLLCTSMRPISINQSVVALRSDWGQMSIFQRSLTTAYWRLQHTLWATLVLSLLKFLTTTSSSAKSQLHTKRIPSQPTGITLSQWLLTTIPTQAHGQARLQWR